MQLIDESAKAKVLIGGEVQETGFGGAAERGAARRGDVARFIAWINILMEVISTNYRVPAMAAAMTPTATRTDGRMAG